MKLVANAMDAAVGSGDEKRSPCCGLSKQNKSGAMPVFGEEI
jgi:hypothetical protein